MQFRLTRYAFLVSTVIGVGTLLFRLSFGFRSENDRSARPKRESEFWPQCGVRRPILASQTLPAHSFPLPGKETAESEELTSSHMNRRIVLKNGNPVRLASKEFAMLEALARNPNKALSRETLSYQFGRPTSFSQRVESLMFTSNTSEPSWKMIRNDQSSSRAFPVRDTCCPFPDQGDSSRLEIRTHKESCDPIFG